MAHMCAKGPQRVKKNSFVYNSVIKALSLSKQVCVWDKILQLLFYFGMSYEGGPVICQNNEYFLVLKLPLLSSPNLAISLCLLVRFCSCYVCKSLARLSHCERCSGLITCLPHKCGKTFQGHKQELSVQV